MSAIEKQLVDSSRMIADMVSARIGDSQIAFDEAVELMERNKYPLSMRASRVVYIVSTRYPHLIRKHIPSFVQTLKKTRVDGVKRSIFAILIETTFYISEEDLGELVELSFNFLRNPDVPIAVRALSIDMILKIIKIYPEFIPELIAVLESILPNSSVGLKNKCKKVLLKLYKLNI